MHFRRVALATAASGLAALLLGTTPASASTPISLLVPQSAAFTVLHHSCGGIQQDAFGTQFDPASGYPDGDAYIWTTCSAGGKGGNSTTYSAWVSATWDFTGAMVTDAVLTAAPSVNPTLSVLDSHGNQLANQTNRAYLTLAAGYVPAPRIGGVSPSSAPQGSAITLTGTGFTGATAVMFGLNPAVSFTVSGDTSITAVAPAVRTGTVDVTVSGPGGTSAINPSDVFTYLRTPRIGGVSPNHGTADGGTKVTITGANFGGPTTVRFGGVVGRSKVVNGTTITAVSPAAIDSGITVDITVTSRYGTSTVTPADRFLYTN